MMTALPAFPGTPFGAAFDAERHVAGLLDRALDVMRHAPLAVLPPRRALVDLATGARHHAGAPLLLEPRAALAFGVPEDPTGSPVPSPERRR